MERGGTLVELGQTGRRRAVTGRLAASLPASNATFFEPSSSVEIVLEGSDLAFASTDMIGLALGANRLLVGSEIIQFRNANALGEGRWSLTGLLRGRAGTEPTAIAGHDTGTPIALLDDRLSRLDPALVSSDPATVIAAIGLGDEAPVLAGLANAGLSRRPPIPVAARHRVEADGSWKFYWTRRARGHWRWTDATEVPLVEEREAYLVVYGPIDRPLASWSLSDPIFTLSPAARSDLVSQQGTGALWVRQIGTYAMSDALQLAILD